jgi:hypothetical protein
MLNLTGNVMQVLDEIGVDVASQVCFQHMAFVCYADIE